tara:strand:+ start:543 stop:1823 length:1281 start_codon:yes stop_codon:yes gene_type:complete
MFKLEKKSKEQTPVKIVDSIMGSGKSTAMFKMMREGYSKENKRYLYISIFNDEVGNGDEDKEGRVHKELPEMDFHMPKSIYKKGKVGGLKPLLKKGCNVSTTHATFKNFDVETIQLMIDGNYTLVIDEAVDCINQYEDLVQDDLNILIASNTITLDESDRLIWSGTRVSRDSVHHKIMRLCETESLYYYKDNIIMWEYPPLLLKELDDVYIVTYLFDGSIMASWMKKNNIEFKWLPHSVLELRSEEDIKEDIRNNLVILKSNSLNKLRSERKGSENQFSVAWYKRKALEEGYFNSVVKLMESTVSRTKTKSGEVFWTTFKKYKSTLTGKGYKKPPKESLEAYLPYTQKAINDYRDHTLCMYGVDVHKTPLEINYLAERGVVFDRDTYSLSEMLQFIFRGSIRKGEHMKVLVLSERMEDLLRGWLDE